MNLPQPLNRYLEHTLLKPDATHKEFEEFLDEAIKYQFAAVCIAPYMVEFIAPVLKDEDIKVSTVVGFPHGNTCLQTKLNDIAFLSQQGVDEIDFVFNIGNLKGGFSEQVGSELENVSGVCKEIGLVSKCIVETCYLDQDEKTFLFKVINGHTTIDYIQTSTGFGTAGADLKDIFVWNLERAKWIKQRSSNLIQLTLVGDRSDAIKFKAVAPNDLDTVLQFIACGTDRIGTLQSVKVMEDYNAKTTRQEALGG